MAAGTGNGDVFAGQRESGRGMIENNGLPGDGLMAGGAIGAQCAVMQVVCFVTGETVTGCIFELIIDVAFLAFHGTVRLSQREGCGVVIEMGLAPAFG